jgi:hypothetical protein
MLPPLLRNKKRLPVEVLIALSISKLTSTFRLIGSGRSNISRTLSRHSSTRAYEDKARHMSNYSLDVDIRIDHENKGDPNEVMLQGVKIGILNNKHKLNRDASRVLNYWFKGLYTDDSSVSECNDIDSERIPAI